MFKAIKHRLEVGLVLNECISFPFSRMMKSSLHAEEDDFVPGLPRSSIHPRERPDWEETLSAMVSAKAERATFESVEGHW